MGKKVDYSTWSKEELIREIESLKKQKTYGLIWENDKTREVFDYYLNWDGMQNKEVFKEVEAKFPVLKEVKDKIITTEKNSDYNNLIEGDNYHALATLNFTHSESIDVIYIDPPYNRGNKDFKYNDQWIDKDDAYRHSKWLSFMEKRLRLAWKLLTKKGIIFISIDDTEYAQLKILCDEIFSERNFIANMIWRKVVGGKSQGKISTQHEYVLTYAKSEPDLEISQLPLDERLLKKYKYEDGRGKYDLRELGQGKGLTYSDSLYYEIEAPDRSIIPKPPKDKGYRWSKEKWMWGLKQNPPYCLVKKVNGRWLPFAKQYLEYDNEGNKIERGLWAQSVMEDKGHTRTGTKNLDDVLGEGKFEHPKPVKLIKYLCSLHPNKNSYVLDFFAGSGTTGHAVLELNKEDGGNRKFILCTNNEGNICTGVCYPRVEKVIKGHKTPDGEKIDGLGGNLRYFKTDFVDSAPTAKNKKKIVDKSTEMICLKENAFNLIKDGGQFKIFKNSKTYLGIVFESEAIEDFVKEAKKIDGKFNVYVFSLDDTVPEREFKELKGRVSLCPIPEAILHVYRRVFAC